MAIRPTGIVAGGVEVYHDERDHSGTIAWADVDFTRQQDGGLDRRCVVLPCPVPGCDSVSLHPIAGGCSPEEVQELFVRFYLRRTEMGATTRRQAIALAKAACDAMDGPGRFRVRDE